VYKVLENGALIEVVDEGGELKLFNSGALQTRGLLFGTEYYQYWSLLPSFYKEPSILLMGLGGGAACRIFDQLYQGHHIDAVDISATMITIAKKYFGVSESEHLRIFRADAYEFALKPPKSYDIAIVDAFQGKLIPPHLLTRDFFVATAKLLTEDGILTVNFSGPSIRTGLSNVVSGLSDLQFTIFFLFTKERTNMIVYCLKGDVSFDEFIKRIRITAAAMSIRKHELAKVARYMEDALYTAKGSQDHKS
jgi:spermidine synthase